ncbi:MAG: DinB family protein [candidate division Zixibacteria bacterium]|nr:DinB family protein [candidate division Zixibacteria bacterium]
MVEITKWIDRKFEFNYPVGVFPWILERLRGTPARIEEIIKDIPPDILTGKSDNKWSIQENIGHLIKVEELHDGRIDDYLAGNDTLRPADMENRRTHKADYNAQNIAEILKMFRSVRNHFTMRLQQQDETIVGRSSFHPRLHKPMRLIDMAYFAAEHDDYHLAVIRRLM